jgi:ubiquinone/menaquinone biosynthesis C-methylase UbiE
MPAAMMRKRSQRVDKLAQLYDEDVLPIWSIQFGRMLLRHVEAPSKAMVLDVGCGTGYPALDVLPKLDEQSRIIAIDCASEMLNVARRKAEGISGKRIFFRTETVTTKLSFASEVYDLVTSNDTLWQLDDQEKALSEFARVCKPGGHVVVTLPLKGSWGEFFDIYREVLTKLDHHEMLQRLAIEEQRYPDRETATRWLEQAGLCDVGIEEEKFELLFRSAREFLFAPVVEYGPLSQWKDVAGKGEEMQDVFWHIKEAIDAYFRDRAFVVTVHAGCAYGTKLASAAPDPIVDAVTAPRPALIMTSSTMASSPALAEGADAPPAGEEAETSGVAPAVEPGTTVDDEAETGEVDLLPSDEAAPSTDEIRVVDKVIEALEQPSETDGSEETTKE